MKNMNTNINDWRKSSGNSSFKYFKPFHGRQKKNDVNNYSMFRIVKFMLHEIKSGVRDISVNIDGICLSISGINNAGKVGVILSPDVLSSINNIQSVAGEVIRNNVGNRRARRLAN